jgi:predicted nucleic acid-binding protein
MIVLDTNVLSELVRREPNGALRAWFASQPLPALFTTTVTQAEMLLGVALLPAGKRRDALAQAIEGLFEEDFTGRVLSFDGAAAQAFAALTAERRRVGRPIAQFDAQVAAIARSRNASLATRNVRDFEGCSLSIINPWGAEDS